jgi:hypothetical protein
MTMRKAFILVYADSLGTRAQVKAIVDKEPLINTWRYDMPHCFYLVSESNSHELAKAIRSAAGDKGRFVVIELPEFPADREQIWGWLPPDTWYFLKEKKPKTKEAEK